MYSVYIYYIVSTNKNISSILTYAVKKIVHILINWKRIPDINIHKYYNVRIYYFSINFFPYIIFCENYWLNFRPTADFPNDTNQLRSGV